MRMQIQKMGSPVVSCPLFAHGAFWRFETHGVTVIFFTFSFSHRFLIVSLPLARLN